MDFEKLVVVCITVIGCFGLVALMIERWVMAGC